MKNLTLNQLTELVMDLAKMKGFGTKPSEISVAEKIALIHSELSEAFDAYRHNNLKGKDGFEEELGDVILRTLHLCGILNISVEKVVLKKIAVNKKRTWNWDKLSKNRS